MFYWVNTRSHVRYIHLLIISHNCYLRDTRDHHFDKSNYLWNSQSATPQSSSIPEESHRPTDQSLSPFSFEFELKTLSSLSFSTFMTWSTNLYVTKLPQTNPHNNYYCPHSQIPYFDIILHHSLQSHSQAKLLITRSISIKLAVINI